MMTRKPVIRIPAILTAVLLAASLTACGGEEVVSTVLGNTNPWVDSDIIGSVPEGAKIRVQDDFAAAVNGPWKLEMGDTYYGTFQEVTDAILVRKKTIAEDGSIPGVTAERLRDYYDLASDWEKRNKDGAEPLRPYIEDIASIGSMEEMYDFFADPERNPLYLAPVFTESSSIMRMETNRDRYAVLLTAPELSLAEYGDNEYYFHMQTGSALEKYEMVRNEAVYLLSELGYSEEEAKKLVRMCMTWEKKVAAADNSAAITSIEEITFAREDLLPLAKGFPLDRILRGWGFEDTEYFLMNPLYAESLEKLCRDSELENIKAFLIVNYCLRCSLYLDRETLDKMEELSEPRLTVPEDYGQSEEQKEDALMFDYYIGASPMVGAMNRIYAENFFDESQVAELNSLTQDVIDGFHEIFMEEEWLSEEGKKRCIEKLDALTVHIAYQDFDSVDYGELEFLPEEEGGNFLEAYFAAKRFEMDHVVWLAQQTYDPTYWDPLNQEFSTTITNAFYMPMTNGIYIFAGVCEAPLYAPELSYEEKLAGLFAIVGHEITHGFDKTGAQYDKDGMNEPWLPMEDQIAFTDRSEDVSRYYTLLSPYEGSGLYAGSNVNGEATADMGGLRAVLHLAEKVPDFDYDRFFRAYANVWKMNIPLEEEKFMFRADVHPLPFYRVNVGLQQFDEFYETYDVKEGDGMYLAPGERIKVW